MHHSFFTTISIVICVWTFILTFVSGNPTLSFNTKETVLIVGAGPAGLSLALGLSRLGWKVRVFEKRLDLMTRGGAIVGIAPNGLKALEELHSGLRDKIMSLSQSNGPSRSMPWCTMRDVLLEEALKEKNIIIETGKCLEDIVEGEEGVTATFRSVHDISSDVEEESMVKIDGAFIVAADGVKSTVRHILNLQESTPTGSKIFRGTVDFQSNDECVDDKETNDYRNALLELKRPFLIKVPTDNRFFLVVVSFNHVIPGRVCWVCHTTEDVSGYDGSDNVVLSLAEMSAANHKDWPMIRFLLSQSTNESTFTETRTLTLSDEELASFSGRWGGTVSLCFDSLLVVSSFNEQ